jgi:hypothetical protein
VRACGPIWRCPGPFRLPRRCCPEAPFAPGKELADRWREKLGQATAARPEGPLVWLHAVGLGEVLALRGLIAAMAELAPEVEFLVTSTTRGSAEVLAGNLPPRTRHQFLPLDAPRYLARFLDHWRPALSVWAEQDIWPGAVVATARRGIPLGAGQCPDERRCLRPPPALARAIRRSFRPVPADRRAG